MSELAAYCEARQKVKLHVFRNANSIKIRVESSYDAVRFGNTEVTLRLPLSRLPKKCLMRSGLEEKLIDWKADTKGSRGGRSLLINVPITAEELEVVL